MFHGSRLQVTILVSALSNARAAAHRMTSTTAGVATSSTDAGPAVSSYGSAALRVFQTATDRFRPPSWDRLGVTISIALVTLPDQAFGEALRQFKSRCLYKYSLQIICTSVIKYVILPNTNLNIY